MKKIIYKLINELTKGSNIYTHNGSTWLIFEDTKQWVIELTKDKVLWYNYTLFKNIFAYASMDVVENQHYITKWVEDNIINGGGVKETSQNVMIFQSMKVEDEIEEIIENGVKETGHRAIRLERDIEEPIQNGIKKTFNTSKNLFWEIGTTIQNGVKETKYNQSHQEPKFKDVLENGVKETIDLWMDDEEVVGYIIETGVKDIKNRGEFVFVHLDDVIENGVKETQRLGSLEVTEKEIDNTIQNGVKHTLYVNANGIEKVKEVIKNGVKIKPALESNEGFKQGTPYVEKFFSKEDVENTIQNGIKKTKEMDEWVNSPRIVENVIQNGIKEVKSDSSQNPMGQVDDVIQNGVKETRLELNITEGEIEEIIENGVKETNSRNLEQFGIGYTLWKTQTVIEQGIKEVQPLPSQKGNRDWGIYYQRKENRTKPHTEYVDDVIKEGIKINK